MKKRMLALAAFAVFSFQSTELTASPNKKSISHARPAVLMQTAYAVGYADGHKDPTLLQAILLQESAAGTMKHHRVVHPNKNQSYFGAMQIKLGAAKDVLKKWPEMFDQYAFDTRTDDEIKARLIVDDAFNIAIASKYLVILRDRYGYTGHMLLNAYNRGPGGAKKVDENFHYAVSAQKKLSAWKQGKFITS